MGTESRPAYDAVRSLQSARFEAPFAAAYAADVPLARAPKFVECALTPGVRYRLTAITEGAAATEDLGALVFFEMADPKAGGEGLRISPKGIVPPHVYLRTGPELHRADRSFTAASPVRRIGLMAWHDRGPVTLRTLVIEPVTGATVDFFFSFDVEASPNRAVVGESAIDTLVWGKVGGGEYGIGRICDVLEHHGIVGNFMIDLASCASEGERQLSEIIDHLSGRGHEVHLHLHPEDLPDPTSDAIERSKLIGLQRVELDRAPEEMSRRLLDYTVAVFERFAKRPPRVFRSGSYRMNAALVLAAGSLGIEALSNVRRHVIADPALRGGDPIAYEPFVWENGVREIPVDISSPEVTTADKYVVAYENAVNQKRRDRTFNAVMHSWSLTGRNEEGVHDRFVPNLEQRLHEMCAHATKHGRARGYGEYLDENPTAARTVRIGAIREP